MTESHTKAFHLESSLATLLQHGAGLTSGIIGLGLLAEFAEKWFVKEGPQSHIGVRVVTLGVGLLILLPVLRLALMLLVFLRQRDYRLGMVTALVLLVIALSFAIGVGLAHSPLPG